MKYLIAHGKYSRPLAFLVFVDDITKCQFTASAFRIYVPWLVLYECFSVTKKLSNVFYLLGIKMII